MGSSGDSRTGNSNYFDEHIILDYFTWANKYLQFQDIPGNGVGLIFYELDGSDACLLVSRVDNDGDGVRDDIRVEY